jgi:hypothetical protein
VVAGGNGALRLDAGDESDDQLVTDRLLVRLGQDVRGGLSALRGRDALDDRGRVLVPGVQALEVNEGDPAMTMQPDGEVCVGHRVHRRGQERDLEPEATEIGGQVDFGGIGGDGPRHERDLLEAVRAPQAALRRIAHGCLGDQRSPPRARKTRAA